MPHETIPAGPLVRELNAMVELFDSNTACLFDRVQAHKIYEAMRAGITMAPVADRFREVCIELGYPAKDFPI